MANATASTTLSIGNPELDARRIVDRAAPRLDSDRNIPDDQLLELFQKRADLKKRYAGLNDEVAQLREQLAQRDAAIERTRAEKKALEHALGDTQTAYPALAYYHLRGLWRSANAHLRGFRDELIEQQRERERKKDIMEFNQSRESQLAALNDRIAQAKAEVDTWRATVSRLEGELATHSGPLGYFQRKKLEPELAASRESCDAARAAIETLFDERIKLESMSWSGNDEVSGEGKRVINLAVLALAQHLFLHFSDNGLGELARRTQLQSLTEMDFSTREDCEFLIHRVSTAVAAMRADRSFAEPLKARAKHLRSVVRFRSDDDCIPVADSVGQLLPSVPGDGKPANTLASVPLDVNVLLDDYWGLGEVLLR